MREVEPAEERIGADDLATRLRLAVGRLARRLRAESAEQLTPSQISALASIDRHGELTIGELAEIEHIKPPSMTRIVAVLEEAGLVTRRPGESDRRVSRISLSKSGRGAVARIRDARSAFLAGQIGMLSPRDRSAIERALPALERLVEGRREA